ncbi:sulfite exporter TauE/SafE family protein [Streptomyces sp. NPDC002599]|uniref:urease accessory protein UreH domain-containing protein n=1 Tax=Streptomyces sp. NPDC002599 TaxID=3154421 RepID=UPI003330FB49
MRAPRFLALCGTVLTAACALVLVPSAQASAHPLGNFTVNRYDGLVAAPGQLRVDHVEDLAEIPATQAKPDIKRLGMAGWARQRCETAARDSEVTVNGRAATLTAGASGAHLRPGQAGLDTLRVECRLTAPLSGKGTLTVGFRGAGAGHGPGWREITARGDRMTLASSDVPRKSVSAELTQYPEALLSSPADTATASLRIRPGGPALVEERRDAPAASVLPRGADRWTQALNDLVARHHLTFGFASLALLIAVGLGAMHALAPGHGKTLMAATAAARGGRARFKDVLPLAASVTVTHTLGVVALGLLVTAGSAAAPSVIAWLGVSSGVLVMGAGATLLRRAWRNRPSAHGHDHGHSHEHGHDHAHEHGQPHDHTHASAHDHAHEHGQDRDPAPDHTHDHESGHTHDHEHPPVPSHTHGHDHDHDHMDAPHRHAGHTARPLVLAHATASVTTGTPTATATAPLPHRHDHSHPHPHDHSHDHGAGAGHGHRHDHDHDRSGATPRSSTLEHTHGGFTHTHEIAPTLRGTILLGFAGGLVPSPSAVVVLVGAAALGQAWFGLLLVLAYGVGLALTLTAAGFAVVKLGSGVNRALAGRRRWAEGRVVLLVRRAAPLGSALIVVALGAGLVLKGAASVLG